MNSIRTNAERISPFDNNRIDVPIYGQAEIQPVFRYFSLIAGALRDKSCKLIAFSYSYSATGGTRTRTRMAQPIE